MRQILSDTKIPFMKYRKVFYTLSGLLMLATLAGLAMNGGPRYSVDFTGGTLMQIRTAHPLPDGDIRAALEGAGFPGADIQALGRSSEFLIRMPKVENAYPRIEAAVEKRFPGSSPELRREETVGARVGKELKDKAGWAVLTSLGGILLYVGVRYDFKFALGAVIALFHDVLAAVGVLVFADREISLTVVAALLTIAGYSINDTIVIFDRIRERSKETPRLGREAMMNAAINETLSRTIITSLTVLMTTLSLFLLGGEVLNDFSLCLLAGLIFGTYSTIYVATGLALDMWNASENRKGGMRGTG